MMVMEATEDTNHWAGLFKLYLNMPVFGCFRQFTKYLLQTLGKKPNAAGRYNNKNIIIKVRPVTNLLLRGKKKGPC
jgi:hypothetical protein